VTFCLANPIACNQAGITAAEVLSEGGVVAGGAVATKKIVDEAKALNQVAKKIETIITPEIEKKILLGQRVINADGIPTNRLIGAHSGLIDNANPNYAVEVLSVNADKTTTVKLLTQFEDGNLSKIKTSTLFPKAWSDVDILDAVKSAGNTIPIAIRTTDGAALFQATVNGVKVEVVKIGNSVTAAYPCGRGCTSAAAFLGN